MELSWKYYLRLYAPFLVLAGINAIGAVYALGYRNGMAAIQTAAYHSAMEAKHGE